MVGDRVQCSEADADTVCIESVEPRSSALERLDRRGRSRILASNFDRMIIVSAPTPGIDYLMIDQYLVAAHSARVRPLLVINKSDLLSQDQRRQKEESLACYAQCGYDLLVCSAMEPQSLATLNAAIDGQACVFVGQSGVGKSSLIRHFAPDQEIAVGALSRAGFGSHTTIAAYWYVTESGGAVIDSPGVREFRVDFLPPEQIAAGFLEIAAHARNCRFNDCTHQHEPDCAVKGALASDSISQRRYANFCSLIAESTAMTQKR